MNIDWKVFARAKPGSTDESVPEVEILEEGQAEEKQKQLYDEQPDPEGWKVLGTIKNKQDYQKSIFIHEIIDVLFTYYSIFYINTLSF